MYDFAPQHDLDKPELYSALARAANALVEGEPDPVANMANIAAAIWQFVPDLNWAGFYRVLPGPNGDELVLGPFIGKPACIRIPIGTGVCGTAAALGSTQVVPDVHAFPGHIACDAESRAELVVPVMSGNRVIAVIDLDSPTPGRFDEEDASGMRLVAQVASLSI
ncbi:GAF domain-containing protein [Novosphingobium mangrovi (ex Huang et al. 2023)]|uniref:GAF domain-containing protein n=1 Tax=Novosphingobium mangrovi (ex Huang et al. 2023) TaxID=2976432 RepID=A0ABT2I9Y0_9SPHN|nr:GAF domain-containing protein [Novosphingobium mangrovi (ex Huang et al. 2023)]MCT2401307.1 GAF domain-containing protein [Novosphingobium mangrovi (ex Huang et al. 2023)]